MFLIDMKSKFLQPPKIKSGGLCGKADDEFKIVFEI
jgi:hypothetical protein